MRDPVERVVSAPRPEPARARRVPRVARFAAVVLAVSCGAQDGRAVAQVVPPASAPVPREARSARHAWTGWRFDHLGFAVAIGGNFDGDARPDLVVGGFTPGADHARVLVLPGQGEERTRAPLLELHDVPARAWGASVAFVGDLDGGGRDDVCIGLPSWGQGPLDEAGALLVWLGERHADGKVRRALDADLVLRGAQRHARLGWSVAAAGDVDGDGWPDVAVGAPGCDHDPADAAAPDCGRFPGEVLLLRGGPEGLGAAATTSVDAADSPAGPGAAGAGGTSQPATGRVRDARAAAHAVVRGEAPGEHFGWALAGLGDLDGDGLAELAVGAPQVRRVSAFEFGRTSGDGEVALVGGTPPSVRARLRAPAPRTEGVAPVWMHGASLAALPADGEAGALLAVGAPMLQDERLGALGGAFLYDARAVLEDAAAARPMADTRDLPHRLLWADGMLGWSIALARQADDVVLLVSAPRAERVDGRVLVLTLPRRTDAPVAASSAAPEWRATLHGETESDKGRFGWALAAADVDGDGRVDALVGANGISVRVGDSEGLENGRAYLLSDVVPRP